MIEATYAFNKVEEAVEFISDIKASGEITSGKTDALYERWSTLYRENNITTLPYTVNVTFEDLGGYTSGPLESEVLDEDSD